MIAPLEGLVSQNALKPEDHVPQRLIRDGQISRRMGDYRFTALEYSDHFGSFDVRLAPRAGVLRKKIAASAVIEGYEMPGWVALHFTVPGSSKILTRSINTEDHTHVVTLTTSHEEVSAHFMPQSEFYTLSVHESLLGDAVGIDFDESLLKGNSCFPASMTGNFEINSMLATMLYQEVSSETLEQASAHLAKVILGRFSKRQFLTSYENRARCVRLAMAYVAEHYLLNPSAVDMANHCHCSLRTLDYAFRTHLNTTPKQYVLAYRLNKFREALLKSPHRSVGEIAYSMGYLHLGNLARTYRNLFGELPSETQLGVNTLTFA